MRIKVVEEAKIKCIKPSELKKGDFILWADFKCKVINIYKHSIHDKHFALIEQFENEPESKMWIEKYTNFYKIIECKLKEIEV